MADYVELSWGYDYEEYWGGSCLVQFEGQVSTDKTFTTGVMPIVSTSLSTPVFERGGVVGGTVESCKTYYWRVRADASAGNGPWSETYSFKSVPPGGWWNDCFKTRVRVTATKNASCRVGPNTFYAISAYVPAGERHPVEGRNAAGTWLKLQDLHCYISRELLELELDGTPFPGGADVSGLISVLPDPPLPTVAPTKGPSGPACSSCLAQGACEAAGGKWTVGSMGCRCVCP
jgi:hypothetical protein